MNPPSSDTSPLARIAKYTEILAKDPNSTVFVPLAELYRRMGMLEDAADLAMKGVRSQPRFSPGYAVLGRIQAQRGDLSGGALSLEKSLAIDPENLVALKSLARIRLQQGEADRSRKLLERAAHLEPGNEETTRLLAKAAGTAGGKVAAGEGAAPISTAREKDSSADPLSTVTIAELYLKQGFPQRAMKVYRDLLRSDPHNEEIRRRLRELKEQEEGNGPHPGKPASTEEAMRAGSPSPPSPAAPEETDVQADPRLRVLEGWLETIRRRREHV